MKTALTEQSWGDLFDFLDPTRRGRTGADRDVTAVERYEQISRKLVCFFAGRGCRDPEDLAENTILRVAAKCRETDSSNYADSAGYFYGVARNVLHEWVRENKRESSGREALAHDSTQRPPLDRRDSASQETVSRRLETCLAGLTERARRLILGYYQGEGMAKIVRHRALAEEFGKSVNALRIEVHRIRSVLRRCVLGQGAETIPLSRSFWK